MLSKTVVPKTSLHRRVVLPDCGTRRLKKNADDGKLRAWTSNMYSSDIIQKMELAVLVELKWELGVITPAHFLESFLAMTCNGTTAEDEVDVGVWTPRYRGSQQLVCQLYSLCVHDIELTNKSRVAAAVIATARLNLGLKPLCRPRIAPSRTLCRNRFIPSLCGSTECGRRRALTTIRWMRGRSRRTSTRSRSMSRKSARISMRMKSRD